MWLHTVSDAVIWLSYMAIPVVLVYFVWRRRDIPFPRVFWMFGAFIVLCGLTHLMEIVVSGFPIYRLSGAVKAATAAVSVGTAIALVPLVPQALALRSPLELERLNRRLEEEARERERAQRSLLARTEALSRANAELERYAYVASHDLQEPLRMVISYGQLLERRCKEGLEPDAERYLRYMVDNAQRMHELIRDLLSYARVGHEETERAPVDLSGTLSQVRASLESALRESGGELSVGPLPTVRAVPTQMAELFLNLVGNAIKYRGDAPPRVDVASRRSGGEWVFSVRDNGIGIDPRYFERIFEAFRRLHGREKYPGTGIGLAICKRIVERHCGRIWVESEPGRGSTFLFTLPAI